MTRTLLLTFTLIGLACHPFQDTDDHTFGDTLEDAPEDGGMDSAADASKDSAADAADTLTDTREPSDAEPELADTLPPGECDAPSACEARYGEAPCGSWACVEGACEVACEGCEDADRDGYGEGDGCAGPDCDDGDDAVGASFERRCYDGPEGTEGVGVCRAGVQRCVAGVIAPCSGAVTPSAEACNLEDDDCDGEADEEMGVATCGLGVCASEASACAEGEAGRCVPGEPEADVDSTCDGRDDDCDGAVDEDCVEACVWVVPGAQSDAPDGSQGAPFARLEDAIARAAEASASGAPRRVCVVGGYDCSQGGIVRVSGDLKMASGVSVYGSYALQDWRRCARLTTQLELGGPRGVVFKDVDAPTVFDGFKVRRDASGSETAGFTLERSTGVTLSNVQLIDQPAVERSYGVVLEGDSEAHITRAAIIGGAGSISSIGVHAVRSRVTITDACPSFDDAGRCEAACAWEDLAAHGIRGHHGAREPGFSAAVVLEDAPGSRLERSALCSGATDTVATVTLRGDATDTVLRGNHISAWGGSSWTRAVFSDGCADTSPWIVDNTDIISEVTELQGPGHGVHVVGACHPILDSNERIGGAGEGDNAAEVIGVYCGAVEGVASRCVITDNRLIEGARRWSDACCTPRLSVGVQCDDGACLRIAGNDRITGGAGLTSIGLRLGRTGTRVSGNALLGGCFGASRSIGVAAESSVARLENNHIAGGFCETSVEAIGMRVTHSGGDRPGLDVHSNVISGGGAEGVGCKSVGLLLETPPAGVGGVEGVYRNNIFTAQACATLQANHFELGGASPRIYAHNDLTPARLLFKDDARSKLSTVEAVNDLGAGYEANFSADPRFVEFPRDLHLLEGSPCEGAGTPVGAPLTDADGDARDESRPDVGLDER